MSNINTGIIAYPLAEYQDIIESIKDYKPQIKNIEAVLEDDYRKELENCRRNNIPKHTGRLLAESPDAQEIIKRQLTYAKEKKQELEFNITGWLEYIKIAVRPEKRWEYEMRLEFVEISQLLEVEKRIRRLKSLLPQPRRIIRNRITQDDITRAKEVPIEHILSSIVELKRSGKNWKCLCIMHQEKTPSFVVFGSTNTCHCFGCQFSADSIGLVQELEKCSFPEAVSRLSRM